MAANKFATTLHRNTHKTTVVLVYAVLEWTLILLLLLNGIFSYIIARFAAFFGLQPPCVFCSRVDHLFDPAGEDRRRRRGSACRDLVCSEHAAEVSGLGYCARHRRLAEAGEMCEDCCPSAPSQPKEAALLSWMRRSEEGEKDLRCSCCGVVLESGFYSPFHLFGSSWGASEHQQKGNLIQDLVIGDDQEKDGVFYPEKVDEAELVSTDQAIKCFQEEEEEEENADKVGKEDATRVLVFDEAVEEKEEEQQEVPIHFSDACRTVDDASYEVLTWNPRNLCDEDRFVPIELIDSTTKSHAAIVHRQQDHVGQALGEDGNVVDTKRIAEESTFVVSSPERTNILKESSPELDEVEHEARAIDVRIITEEKELDSVSKMSDIVEVNPLGKDGVSPGAFVLDIGCITLKEKVLISSAGYAATVKENLSADQHVVLDTRSIPDETNALVCPEERADTFEEMGRSQLCSMPEVKTSISTKEHDKCSEYIFSEMNQTQECAVSEEKKALSFADEMAGTFEENSSEQDGTQKCSTILHVRSISKEEKALGPAPECDDAIVEDAKEMVGAEQCNITLDIENSSEEMKALSSISNADDIVEQNSADLPSSNLISEYSSDHHLSDPQETPIITLKGDYIARADEEVLDETKDNNKCEISLGSELCDQKHIVHTHPGEPAAIISESTQDQLSEGKNEMSTKYHETLIRETEATASVSQSPNHIAVFPENNDIEEERAPETPIYTDDIHGLSKRFLFGRRESGTESLDGSTTNEFEVCDTFSLDQLKAALIAERKALSALYAELEEERSAAAIAANQTMAMITRLQEEKAAMQMEALQYHRMMEEQSEYDQEALHLMNELMMKKEKERQEMEKELEKYRKKILRYVAKESRRMASHKVNGSIVASSSSAEDSDDLSFESNERDEFAYEPDKSHQNTPADDVLSSGTDQGTAKHLCTLRESLADFEEERQSILEQLKSLERKLTALDDEEHQSSEVIIHMTDENGHVSNGNYEPSSDDFQDYLNGSSDELGASRKLHNDQRSMGFKGKRLLPLFDAMSDENEDDDCSKDATDETSLEKNINLIEDNKNIAIVEEVDNIYERLDALESDREFLKHCVNSLKKGDRGVQLLQEILEHLRDLRSVEHRLRNSSNAIASSSA